ncbi:LPS sulfotransferase NodH [Streptomyces sp. TLI_235]|nr:Stf0 family sulfotransferase [Streptomyces sp. TLI_235]PBC76730.1 LPS sulfotransferase NodH [Streptomyces sp. TLI_235]
MGYVVATSPRSGSWLLCELLGSTGIAGRPGEYGAREDAATWRGHYGYSSHAEYFFRFAALMTTANGVFGAKLMWPQWSSLGRDARRYLGREPEAFTLLDSLAGPLRMLRLRRLDTVRQAVSLARAQQTGQWSLRHGEIPRGEAGTYDAEAVRAAHAALQWQNAEWDRELRRLAVPVLDLEYEALAADPEGTLRAVLEFLELPYRGRFRPPTLRRQADARTEDWVSRARADLARTADGSRMTEVDC